VHARSGVACADCHMPYMRDGATKVSDHWVRSPLLNVNRACQTCHLPARRRNPRAPWTRFQQRNYDLMQRGGVAIVALLDAIQAAKAAGATEEQLKDALDLQRKAQWRLDFIAAENSMGFHAPQEAAMVLGEALDYARQGELRRCASRRQGAAGCCEVDGAHQQTNASRACRGSPSSLTTSKGCPATDAARALPRRGARRRASGRHRALSARQPTWCYLYRKMIPVS